MTVGVSLLAGPASCAFVPRAKITLSSAVLVGSAAEVPTHMHFRRPAD